MANPDGCLAKLAISLTDGTASITQVSPDHVGKLKATILDANGAPVPSVVVTFQTNDATGTFVPSAGTALTQADGTASVDLAAGSKVGAFTVRASAVVKGSGIGGALTYQVRFPTLSLGPLSFSPSALSAGGNASVSVNVSADGAVYTAPLSVAFSSPCVTAGKASIGSPVLSQNGIAIASYSDKGCGVPDVVTASVSLGDASATQAGTLTVLPATAGSIVFASADTTNISLKGTGGAGRQEYSTLKFLVRDTTGNKVGGTKVNFSFANCPAGPTTCTTLPGGLSLFPASATSNADGEVTTLVSAGTVPTSVRVVASIQQGAQLITTLSNLLVLSTGVPDQQHFSLATKTFNCEGWVIDQRCSVVTVHMSDHFGNPVPDGTAVNFSAEGGSIGASCITGSGSPTPAGQTTDSAVGPGSGSCSVDLFSTNPRPTGGRVTILAYALGEETLSDNNGNNLYDAGDTFMDLSPNVFRDDAETGVYVPGEPCIGPPSAQCNTTGDGFYNGVLNAPSLANPQQGSETTYVSGRLVQIFSGSEAFSSTNPPSFAQAPITCQSGRVLDFQVIVHDINRNPMPAGTTIAFTPVFAGNPPVTISPATITVKNATPPISEKQQPGIPLYAYYASSITCPGEPGKITVTVTAPSGTQTIGGVVVN